MHITLNWCFTRVLIDAIGFNRCFIISSFNLATLQLFFKKHQNRRYYHFKTKIFHDPGAWYDTGLHGLIQRPSIYSLLLRQARGIECYVFVLLIVYVCWLCMKKAAFKFSRSIENFNQNKLRLVHAQYNATQN